MNSKQRIAAVLADVTHPGYTFQVLGDFDTACYLQASFACTCSTTGASTSHKTRKWMLSEHMTPSEIVLTAFKCVMTSLEHEAREVFAFKGQPILGPHFDVEDMVQVCRAGRFDAGARYEASSVEAEAA